MNAAGLIANVLEGSSVAIENCRSSVVINSSYNGATENGGFISRQSGATVVIKNSKFDGAFEGDNSSENGGFVGWVARGSKLSIDYSLFAPDHLSTKADKCDTWAVLDSLNVTYTLTNSHASREFTATVMIGNAADWHKFAVMVNEAVNQYDVNAILTADITTSEHVGVTEGAVYRGTFDGNGHTLTFNKDWTENERFIAPFRHASNATIKNLHVAGTIKSGQKYPAGIIAQVINGTTTIENCRSSVTLNSTITGESTLAGGLVGRVSNSKVTIRNSKFDGSFEGDKSIGNGGFIAWVDEKSSATIIDCLFMPASVKTDPELSETWARQDEKGTVSIANCYATEEFCRIINDANDWEAFRTALSNRGSKSVNAILNANFSIDHSAVNFKGTFDGNRYTLNLNGTDGTFLSAEDYTIKNLHVTGSMGGDQHVAGLVGSSFRGNIQSCWVSVGIHCNTTHAGGFIGHAHDTQHTINNCLFDGSVSAKNDGKNDGTSYVGAFIGWAGGADNYVTNCLEDGNYYYVDHAGFCYKGNGDAWGNTGNSKNNYTYKGVSWNEVNYDGIRHNNISYVVKELGDGWYAEGDDALPKMTRRDLWNNVGSLSANDLASKLGNGWYVEDGKVLPVMALGTAGVSEEELARYYGNGWTKEGDKLMPATTTEAYYEYTTVNDPKLKGMFYHKNNGTIDKTLLTQTRQSSVLLSWSTDNKPIDYFRVLRRVQGQGEDAWQEVATGLTDMSYEDTSVSPLLTYEYKVEAVNDCEGRTVTETNATVGECKHTGRVEGYVRFNDGTGAPAIGVIVTYNDNTVATAETDESGYFEVDELSYQGGTDVTYSVGPAAESGVNIDPVAVTFDATSNNRVLREFTIENGRRFSGYVMYEGTSIPVKGVNFLVDGNRIHNAQGKYVETDYDGSFSFRVLNGQHTIQAVMDKHVFTNDGWYKNSQKQNLTADVAGIYFYDDTKVTLTGRIVGGDDQGLKPLMNNLSQNNLGDSLTMVLTLEGDNTSWLVYDNQHPNRTKREEVVNHPVKGDKHYTQVTTERKRMVVHPDAATGEYTLKLPPVRWKVQQVYCSGYATLFQEGQVSEVIDLTNALDTVKVNYDGIYYDADEERVENPTAKYHAVYNRIYHSPVEVTYKQIGYDNFDYLGDKTYASSELTGETVQVPLVYSVRKPNWPANRKDSLVAVYTLGHPVFSIERKYNIQLQVGERYLYNNDPLGRVDMVPLKGGMAYMQNGMRALSMDDLNTVERDGTFIQAEPLQGYVLNMIPAGAGQDIMTEGAPILYDILRDPPGAYSTNTLAKGATINFTYMMNASITAGPVLTLKYGEKLETVTASVHTFNTADSFFNGASNGTAIGPIQVSDAVDTNIDMFVYNGSGSKAFSHTMVVGNNISTSGDPSMVGADADLYIGSVQNVRVTPMSTIRAVTAEQMTRLAARLGKTTIELLNEGAKVESEVGQNVDYGSVSVIATGLDANGKPIYLIRDIALGYGPTIQSNFVYSQKQLLTQIIPAKAKEIVDLMYLGTKEEAQAIANRTKKPVYLSLREPTDPMFAVVNKKVDGKVDGHPYNITKDKADEGVNYLVVLPTNASEQDYSDEVEEKYQVIKAWADMIAQNENEKLHVHDKVNNFDIAGAAGVNYSETFDASYSSSWSNFFPIGTEVDYFGMGTTGSNFTSAASIAGTLASVLGQVAPVDAVPHGFLHDGRCRLGGSLLQPHRVVHHCLRPGEPPERGRLSRLLQGRRQDG